MNRSIRPLVVGALTLAALPGCIAFTSAKLPRFDEPGARAAALLAPIATPPAFVVPAAASALVEVRPVDGGVLLDFAGIDVCGPLVLVDPASGATRWTHARNGLCQEPVLAAKGAYLTFEESTVEKRTFTAISSLDAATGQPQKRVEAPPVLGAVLVGGDVVTLEGDAKARAVVARAADTLAPRWTLPLTADEATRKVDRLVADEVTNLVAGPNVIYAVGAGRLVTIDAGTGQRVASLVVASAAPLVAVPHEGGLIVTASPAGAPHNVSGISPQGAVAWTTKGMALAAVVGDEAILVAKDEIALVRARDGELRWRGKVPGVIAGRPVVAGGAEKLVLVPHAKGVTALDGKTGGVRFTVAAQPSEQAERHVDQLIVEADGLVVWDTARHVVGFDLTGKVRYALAVRSFESPHRESRAVVAHQHVTMHNQKFESAAVWAATFSGAAPVANGMTADGKISTQSLGLTGGVAVGTAQIGAAMSDYANTMAQIAANELLRVLVLRRGVQLQVAERVAKASAETPFLVRPIVWNIGRGFLVVRKADGAFAEVVTGPSDAYEDTFALGSAGAYFGDAGMLLTFTEGLAPKEWKVVEATSTFPMIHVQRHLMGFALAASAFRPAAEYATASKVKDGAFTSLAEAGP